MVLTVSRAAAARGRRDLCSVSAKMFSGQLRPSAPWTRTRSSPFLLCLNAGSRESMVAHTYEHFKREFMLASPAEAQRIDLWEEESMKYELEHVEAKQSLLHGRGSEVERRLMTPVEAMATTLLDADVLIVCTPMWNWSVPHRLKQYIDTVVQPGLTFIESDRGPFPVRPNRHLLLVTSTGGDYSAGTALAEKDFLTPYLRAIFALVGFDKAHHVYIKNAAHAQRDTLLRGACADAAAIARGLAADFRRL